MIRKLGIFVLAPVAVLFTMALPHDVFAQEPTSQEKSESRAGGRGQAKQRSGEDGRGSSTSKKITLDDAFRVEDKREKPSAFYVFRRSKMDYDWARLEVQFTPLVLESVQDPLF